jgi:hypothetical protein
MRRAMWTLEGWEAFEALVGPHGYCNAEDPQVSGYVWSY